MRVRALVLLLCLSLPAAAQMKITVEQLRAFIQSAVQLKQDDRKVADYLRKMKLTNQLDDRTIEDLQGLGAGPKTVAALHELAEAAASLPKAPPPPPKPVYVPPPPPDAMEQKRVLEAARDYAINYTTRLPDFICTQVTRRFVDPTGHSGWYPADTITERLSYYEHKENYKVILVNSKPMDVDHEKLGGAISSGEWASMMREIFDPSTETTFDWERWATLRGRRTHVFSYTVSQARSKYQIYVPDRHIIVGYHGLIYVDKENESVEKITLQAVDIPADFPVQDVHLTLDYDKTDISGHSFTLPLKFVLNSREGKYLIKNEVEFRMYRKFSTEATITFETPAPLSPDATKEEPADKTAPKNK
ncbi:MAG TPA: hypothetical protein VFA33_22620 [Bryobacteraceae bacterium]|nr:hypothetical protein [Bryobacteraceae bacterium]